ncbi:MAG: hypothetical protein PHW34_16340 [Hespellia sp.]|nr:hypothetical protein [Hespellia sp.]
MSTKKDCSLPDTTELKQMIIDNPELPLLIFCGEESYDADFSYSQANAGKPSIATIILYGDVWIDEDDYRDSLSDNLCDEEEYRDLSDVDYDKMIDKKVEEAEFVKAIVIYVG